MNTTDSIQLREETKGTNRGQEETFKHRPSFVIAAGYGKLKVQNSKTKLHNVSRAGCIY